MKTYQGIYLLFKVHQYTNDLYRYFNNYMNIQRIMHICLIVSLHPALHRCLFNKIPSIVIINLYVFIKASSFVFFKYKPSSNKKDMFLLKQPKTLTKLMSLILPSTKLHYFPTFYSFGMFILIFL